MLQCEKSMFKSLKQLKKENKSFKIYHTGTAMLKTDKKNRLASVFMEKEWEQDSMSEWSTVRLKIV